MASQAKEDVPEKFDDGLRLFLHLSKIKERFYWLFGPKEIIVTKLF